MDWIEAVSCLKSERRTRLWRAKNVREFEEDLFSTPTVATTFFRRIARRRAEPTASPGMAAQQEE